VEAADHLAPVIRESACYTLAVEQFEKGNGDSAGAAERTAGVGHGEGLRQPGESPSGLRVRAGKEHDALRDAQQEAGSGRGGSLARA